MFTLGLATAQAWGSSHGFVHATSMLLGVEAVAGLKVEAVAGLMTAKKRRASNRRSPCLARACISTGAWTARKRAAATRRWCQAGGVPRITALARAQEGRLIRPSLARVQESSRRRQCCHPRHHRRRRHRRRDRRRRRRCCRHRPCRHCPPRQPPLHDPVCRLPRMRYIPLHRRPPRRQPRHRSHSQRSKVVTSRVVGTWLMWAAASRPRALLRQCFGTGDGASRDGRGVRFDRRAVCRRTEGFLLKAYLHGRIGARSQRRS